jgi:hypothetical protein
MSLSAEGDHIIRELVDAKWYTTEVAAFEAAIAIAIGRGLGTEKRKLSAATTKFNVGSLDPRVRELVLTFRPDAGDRPYELANQLAEAGLQELGRVLREDADLSEVLDIAVFREGDATGSSSPE